MLWPESFKKINHQQNKREINTRHTCFRAGEFFGIVAEGNTAKFQDVFREERSVALLLERIRTTPAVNANYERINQDLEQIVLPGITPFSKTN